MRSQLSHTLKGPCVPTSRQLCICAPHGCPAMAHAYPSPIRQLSAESHPTLTDFHPDSNQISNTDIFRTKTPNSTKFKILMMLEKATMSYEVYSFVKKKLKK